MQSAVFMVDEVHEQGQESRSIDLALHKSGNAYRFSNIVEEVFDFHKLLIE